MLVAIVGAPAVVPNALTSASDIDDGRCGAVGGGGPGVFGVFGVKTIFLSLNPAKVDLSHP